MIYSIVTVYNNRVDNVKTFRDYNEALSYFNNECEMVNERVGGADETNNALTDIDTFGEAYNIYDYGDAVVHFQTHALN